MALVLRQQDSDKDDKRFNNYWDTCDPTTAHLEFPPEDFTKGFNIYGGLEKWMDIAEERFGKKYEWDGSTVLDYGCGGGNLGQYMITRKKVSKYIGLDISDRSLSVASQKVNQPQAEFYREEEVSFEQFSPDFIVCLAVIQHFPSFKYYKNWCERVNNSGAKDVIIQVRDLGDHAKSIGVKYEENDDPLLALRLSDECVVSDLTNYQVKWTEEAPNDGRSYKYFGLERK